MHFLVIISLMLALASEVMAGAFRESCTNIGYVPNVNDGGWVLAADCLTMDGQTLPTAISLDECLGDNAGFLSCPGTGYGKHCNTCHIQGATQVFLACTCSAPDLEWPWVVSLINLDDCIGNCDGDLCC